MLVLSHRPVLATFTAFLRRQRVKATLGRASHQRCRCSTADSAIDRLLDRPWQLETPVTKVKTVVGSSAFQVIQDDLLHPVLGGNKLRKLDALLPALQESGVQDVVTCGGLQSAHTAAVAAACAERGMRAHLLIRGEVPATPTGYHLLARMLGDVTYVPRSEYADRAAMFARHTARVRGLLGPGAKVHALQEGAAEPLALLGLIRLVRSLRDSELPPSHPCSIIVDSGTGVTAVGIALGIALLGLPWKVHGVMVAGTAKYYSQQQTDLLSAFKSTFPTAGGEQLEQGGLPVVWRERLRPRKFGSMLAGDMEACREAARATGILLDPIYSLAAWEVAQDMSLSGKGERVVMLHSGGALGLHGLAQRWPDEF